MRRLRTMGYLPALMSRYHLSHNDIINLPIEDLEDLLFDLAERS